MERVMITKKKKNKWISFFLCLFTIFGHKIYEEKYWLAFIYYCTIGFFGIGWFIDLISLLFKPDYYYIEKKQEVSNPIYVENQYNINENVKPANTYNQVKNNYAEYNWCDSVKIQYGSLLDSFDALDKQTQKDILLKNEYGDLVSKHFELLEQEDMLYSTAINLPTINNDATTRCIKICLEDISYAKKLKKYWKATNHDVLPQYTAYYYLTQLYDKLGMIDDAIKICKQAVDLGYLRDNSRGGMPARLARLLKKKSKNMTKFD